MRGRVLAPRCASVRCWGARWARGLWLRCVRLVVSCGRGSLSGPLTSSRPVAVTPPLGRHDDLTTVRTTSHPCETPPEALAETTRLRDAPRGTRGYGTGRGPGPGETPGRRAARSRRARRARPDASERALRIAEVPVVYSLVGPCRLPGLRVRLAPPSGVPGVRSRSRGRAGRASSGVPVREAVSPGRRAPRGRGSGPHPRSRAGGAVPEPPVSTSRVAPGRPGTASTSTAFPSAYSKNFRL